MHRWFFGRMFWLLLGSVLLLSLGLAPAQAASGVEPRHVTLPESISGLSETFKSQLREAMVAYESGGEENLHRAREILKGLIPEASSSVEATGLMASVQARLPWRSG